MRMVACTEINRSGRLKVNDTQKKKALKCAVVTVSAPNVSVGQAFTFRATLDNIGN